MISPRYGLGQEVLLFFGGLFFLGIFFPFFFGNFFPFSGGRKVQGRKEGMGEGSKKNK